MTGLRRLLAALMGISTVLAGAFVLPGAAAEPGAPVITSVSPATGPTAGGTRVRVRGTGLGTATAIRFGGRAGVDLQVVNSTTVLVTAPPRPTATVDITADTAAGRSALTTDDRFTFADGAIPVVVVAPAPSGLTARDITLKDVSCPADAACFAVGDVAIDSSRTRGIVEMLREGSWTPTRLPVPLGLDPAGSTELVAIDCVTQTFCAAIGSYLPPADAPRPPEFRRLMSATWDGQSWATTSPDLPGDALPTLLSQQVAVDCAAVNSCVAVGSYRTTVNRLAPLSVAYDGIVWSSQRPSIPAAAGDGASGSLADISCPAVGACVAVGSADPIGRGLVQIQSNGVWRPSLSKLPPDAIDQQDSELVAVSCSARGTCVAVGPYISFPSTFYRPTQMALIIDHSTREALALPRPTGDRPMRSSAGAISCWQGTECLVGGTVQHSKDATSERAVLDRLTADGEGAGVATSNVGLGTVAKTGWIASVSCDDDGVCVGVGRGAFADQPTALLTTITPAGAATTIDSALPEGAVRGSLAAVDLDPLASGTAVGAYLAPDGSYGGAMLVSGIVVPQT